jgi:hypothetical protein
MKLCLRKSDFSDDWYVIERAEHDGREWLQKTGPNIMAFMRSARISDADVEGTLSEMKEIGQAIENRSEASFKRCSVRIDGERAFFDSPRNSTREGECSLAEADELAALIRAEVTRIENLKGQEASA